MRFSLLGTIQKKQKNSVTSSLDAYKITKENRDISASGKLAH